MNSVWGDDDFEMMLLDTVKDKVARLKGKESIRERQRAPVDTLNSLTYLIEYANYVSTPILYNYVMLICNLN